MSKRIAVAVSGGVDSFTAAFLLKEKGYEVIALWMYVVDEGPMERSAPFRRAREGARRLGVPFVPVDLRGEFEEAIIRPFLEEYLRGRTPNPCALCNPRIKFGVLWSEARRLGAEGLATGHYVRKEMRGGEYLLLRGVDSKRDQSYFLWGLPRGLLPFAHFPLGGMRKEEVREKAKEAGYPFHDEDESHEICFIRGDYRKFIEERVKEPPRPGEIVDKEGRVLGRHRGIHTVTVGQRRGLGIRRGRPLYVLRVEPEGNRIVVGEKEDLFRHRLRVKGVNWLHPNPLRGEMEVEGRIRYQHSPAPCRIMPQGEGLLCDFEEPQQAPTPGQAIAFYQGEVLLGGGWIEEVVE